MPRSIVGQTSNNFNEISVSRQSAEQFQASGSVEQPSSEVSLEQDRSSSDDFTEIQRPPRSGANSPTSIDIGGGQHYRDRSQPFGWRLKFRWNYCWYVRQLISACLTIQSKNFTEPNINIMPFRSMDRRTKGIRAIESIDLVSYSE